jgi:hypothetical protein
VVDSFLGRQFRECLAALEELQRFAGQEMLVNVYRKYCMRLAPVSHTEPFDGVIELEDK